MSGWGWVAMTVTMVLFWGLLIVGGVLLVRTLNRPPSDSSGIARPTPEQVLAERFARGEIDEDEYRRRLSTLSSPGLTPRP